jgi:hypothetical protein
MKHVWIAMAAGLAMTVAAWAQAPNPPTSTSTAPPAVATGNGDSNTIAAPVAGKNSFTELQARKRLRMRGYAHASGLKQDDQGIWRGSATKDGKTVSVSVDYQGNVTGE